MRFLIVLMVLVGLTFPGTALGMMWVNVFVQGDSDCPYEEESAAMCVVPDGDYFWITVVEDPVHENSFVICEAEVIGAYYDVCFCHDNPALQTELEDAEGWAQFWYRRVGGSGQIRFAIECVGSGESYTTSWYYFRSYDIDGDCKVSAEDFSIFAALYLSTNPIADFNCDGRVDSIDFALFASHYGDECTFPKK